MDKRVVQGEKCHDGSRSGVGGLARVRELPLGGGCAASRRSTKRRWSEIFQSAGHAPDSRIFPLRQRPTQPSGFFSRLTTLFSFDERNNHIVTARSFEFPFSCLIIISQSDLMNIYIKRRTFRTLAWVQMGENTPGKIKKRVYY